MSFSTLVSAQVLAENIQRSDWLIFDCRFDLQNPEWGEIAYKEGHIPGARYVHLEQDLSGSVSDSSGRHPLPNPELLSQKLSVWGVSNQTQVVVYDDHACAYAARMWWLLRWLGHEAVACLDGGIKAWTELDLALISEGSEKMPGNFAGTPDDSMWVTADQVRARIGETGQMLLDARTEERFRGENEPIDKCAGHVPEACNRPFSWNLDEWGYFLLPGQLHEQFAGLLDGIAPQDVVHMCGSGITACHNLLAMEVAGLTGSRLFAGSWSEWITDSERPIVVGP